MKELKTYITEKLHLDKDTKVNKIDELKNLIEDYFKNTLKYKNTDYIYSFRTVSGEITNDDKWLDHINILLTNIKNGQDISSDLVNIINNKYKKVRVSRWVPKNKSIHIFFF